MIEENDLKRYDSWARHHSLHGTTELIPAATVVILRDQEHGLEVLMLRKNSKIAFGGAWVFPGGRIDPEDQVTGADGSVDDLATASAAAAREAAEEADITVDAENLVWFAHWTPPPITPKRYATFFLAARSATGNAGEVAIDHGEITEHEWMRPQDALTRRDQGDIELVVPTWMSLTLLTRFANVDQALVALDDMDPIFYLTHMARTDNGPVAMWEGDAGYEATDPSILGTRHRLTLGKERFVFEQTTD